MIKKFNLSILIPAWNAEKYIHNCINSIFENDYGSYKIILIAGGSDKTYEIALNLEKENRDRIKVLEQIIPHKNKALNCGLKEAEGDIIVLTDIDCIYPKSWLITLNNFFQNKTYNVVTSSFLPFQQRKKVLTEYYRLQMGNYITSRKEFVQGKEVWGGMVAFRREIFINKIGKFDEKALTATDRTLGLEFNKQGEKIYFSKDLTLFTECYTNNIRKFIKKEIRWARNSFFPLIKKDIPKKILLRLFIGLFRLGYPIFGIIISFIFFNISFVWFFLIPWFVYYVYFLIRYYFKLKIISIRINSQLGTNFLYKKAYKIIPLLFFINGFINIAGYIFPKRSKWFS